MADNFNAIQSTLLAAQRGLAISLNNSVDVVMVHYFREGTVNLAATRRRDRWQPVPGPCVGAAAKMRYLAHERTVVLMDALGEFKKVWNH